MARPLYSGIGTILAFHRVCPRSERSRVNANSRLEVTPEYLENVIKFLATQGYEVISLEQLLDIFDGRKINKKFAIFTFDDGYADIFTYAYPIFKKYNVPFTVYVTTNFPDRKAVMWWNLLENLILQNSRLSIEVNSNTVEFDCSSIEQKENVFCRINSIIMNEYKNDRQQQIKKFFDSYNIDIYEETAKLALSWKQIEQLAKDSLVTIGSHTINHFPLNQLSSLDVEYEISESKRIIESHINRSVEHFCYPFGTDKEIGIRECDLVKQCGFKTALTSRKGNIFLAHKDYAQCLPRAIISGEREGKNIQYLNLWMSGFVSCIKNKFKRISTL